MLLGNILVDTNDPANKQIKLNISGKVEEFAGIQPKSVFLQGKAGEMIQAKVSILPNLKYPFHIVRFNPGKELEGNIEVALSSSENGYALIIKNLLNTPGNYLGRIQLVTDNTMQPEMIINVRGKIL